MMECLEAVGSCGNTTWRTGLQAGEFQQSCRQRVFFAVGVVPGDYFRRTLTANHTKPQMLLIHVFCRSDAGMVGGTSNLHGLTSFYSSSASWRAGWWRTQAH